jgi:uncharacterized membrane protein
LYARKDAELKDRLARGEITKAQYDAIQQRVAATRTATATARAVV